MREQARSEADASEASTRPLVPMASEDTRQAPKGIWGTRIGVVAIVLSCLLWVPLPVLPFLPVEASTKAWAAGGLVVTAEIAWWAGAALAGPEAFRRLRRWLRRPPAVSAGS